MLPFLLASAIVPIGQAALAEPGKDIDATLNSHGNLVATRADQAYRSGQFSADSADPDKQNFPFEASDLLRREMNAVSLTQVATRSPALAKEKVEAANRKFLAGDSVTYEAEDFTGDSATEGGTILMREIEAVWSRVLMEAKPNLMGPKLFPINTDAKPGQDNLRISRFLERGQATFWNGGTTPIPTVSLRQVATHVYFRHIVSAAQWNIFDQLSWDIARINGVQKSLAAAKRVIEELWDKVIWEGAVEHGLYGILNFPYMSRRIVATTFSGSTDVDTMASEIQGLYTYPSEASNGAFEVDTILFGSKLYNFLAGKRLGTNNDSSVMDFIQKQLQAIYKANGGSGDLKFMSVARLNDVGGSGVHGVLAYKNDPDCISLPVSQPTTMLPLGQIDMNFRQVLYMTMAGVIMPNAGNVILGLVPLE